MNLGSNKLSRRAFITTGSGIALATLGLSTLSVSAFGQTASEPSNEANSLRFLIDRNTSFELSNNNRVKLERAVYDFMKTHYNGITLQFWNQPFEQIDFEKRLTNIIYWINKAIAHHQALYPVDPIWVLSQIKAESLFCEFALSRSLAAGICQFMPYTARAGHQMIVAGDLPEHHLAPYKKPELANSLRQYDTLIKERNNYIKSNKSAKFFNLRKALDFMVQGKSGAIEAEKQLKYLEGLKEINQNITEAKENYTHYLETNINELGKRDLFGEIEFFNQFDERFTYKKPIFAMVKMLANALRVRNGNILAASAAYNAGLSRTWTSEPIYTQYGLMPAYEETSLYVSKIIANYEEISQRYYS
ncbi:transglycosylase SLT domain-containing protein [Alkalimarinus coralli]|uniref:transglycosylase SLT domain-containing protein n=1 Tax=Alkalimarinus coralli TaxID=2935863 RepID=UPI00202AEE82|nr:transglycosylase SLT domain-containing protein [Alkalimarinus coralli]